MVIKYNAGGGFCCIVVQAFSRRSRIYWPHKKIEAVSFLHARKVTQCDTKVVLQILVSWSFFHVYFTNKSEQNGGVKKGEWGYFHAFYHLPWPHACKYRISRKHSNSLRRHFPSCPITSFRELHSAPSRLARLGSSNESCSPEWVAVMERVRDSPPLSRHTTRAPERRFCIQRQFIQVNGTPFTFLDCSATLYTQLALSTFLTYFSSPSSRHLCALFE